MSKAKWIKIVTDIFDDEKMLLIDDMPRSDAILVIWFKLLCLAGKQGADGMLTVSDTVAYTDEMLAAVFHRPLSVVRTALETFEKFGMIEVVHNSSTSVNNSLMMNKLLTIKNWGKYQAPDLYEKKKERDRLYQAKSREKKRVSDEKKSSDNRLTSDDASSDNRLTSDDASSDSRTKEERTKEENELSKNDSNTLNILNNNISIIQEGEAPVLREDCPYRKIRDLYHSICISFPKIKGIDGSRRKTVAARWRTNPSLDTFEELFRIAEASSFLKGQNSRNWSANFDWLMNAANFTKVLEHRYDGRDGGPGAEPCPAQTGSFDTDEFFEAALARAREESEKEK